ncbi:MAG: 3-dehydroquinate synthase, partial [Ktedonobacteraceae bacterium]|nr:3-dehydroquinate synthase [Ktedonobacteraceae bacterium]
MRVITEELTRSSQSHVYIGQDLLSHLDALIPQALLQELVLVISDSHVASIWGATIQKVFEESGRNVKLINFQAGEEYKTMQTVNFLLANLIDVKAHRRMPLIALGGGVVCDTVGFLASMFMRGVPYVTIPTTLLAQVDAAIGGKVGINYEGKKNHLGGFYAPLAVVIDPIFLTTSSERDIASGLAEVVKMSIIDS